MLRLLIVSLIFKSIAAQTALCTQDFCDTLDVECAELPEECTIQNVTHNGLHLPYMGPCNCCDYCLINLAQGDTCSVGNPTSSVPSALCGPGLACLELNGVKTCEKIVSPCTEAQKKYDNDRLNGELGYLEVRPVCDAKGLYAPFVCVPGEICYCVDEDGNRIFGEIPFVSVPFLTLKCGCSRAVDASSKFFGRVMHRNEYLRCTSDGNYDAIQCIENGCRCVDSIDAKPTYPDSKPINISDISENTLPCFNSAIHASNDYYRICEDKYIRVYEDVMSYKTKGYDVYGDVYPNCQLDGKFAAVQEYDGMQYCTDPEGNILKNEYGVEYSGKLYSQMDCKCARTRYLMTGDEKPTCQTNGNYEPKQCRRGLCRCVDSNGNQIKKEIMGDIQCDVSREALKDVQENSSFFKEAESTDTRRCPPRSRNVNADYGWLSTLEEFQLERFGPDTTVHMPLPDQYVLMYNRHV